jgi:hypothetical protein
MPFEGVYGPMVAPGHTSREANRHKNFNSPLKWKTNFHILPSGLALLNSYAKAPAKAGAFKVPELDASKIAVGAQPTGSSQVGDCGVPP